MGELIRDLQAVEAVGSNGYSSTGNIIGRGRNGQGPPPLLCQWSD
jgi:hypothetical protein